LVIESFAPYLDKRAAQKYTMTKVLIPLHSANTPASPTSPSEDVTQPLIVPVTKHQRFINLLKSQISVRNIFFVLIAIFLIVVSVAVWSLSYAGTTLSINELMVKLRDTAAHDATNQILQLFQVSEAITSQMAEYFWAFAYNWETINMTQRITTLNMLYATLKPHIGFVNSINFERSDGTMNSITYEKGMLPSEWRTSLTDLAAGTLKANLNVSNPAGMTLINPKYTAFYNYSAVIATFATAFYTAPPTGMFFPVTPYNGKPDLFITSSATPFYDRKNGQLLGFNNVIFYVNTLKAALQSVNPSKAGVFLAILQDDMVIVADSDENSALNGTLPCSSNSTSVQSLCGLINNIGGIQNFGNNERVLNLPGPIGSCRVMKSTISRGQINWHLFIALPDSEYYGPVVLFSFNTIWVAVALVIISLIICFISTFTFLRTLSNLSKCFSQIQMLNLDSNIIVNVLKKDSIVHEINSLQKNFRSMLSTLKSFQKYIPREIVQQLVTTQQEAVLGLEKRVCTVFFLDVAGFTSISEQLDPDMLLEIMSEVFGVSSRIIVQHGGNIDKYIGDALMCFWNAPSPVNDHELKAVLASIEIQRFINDLRNRLLERGLPRLSTRIGLHTGQVLVGNFGSNERYFHLQY
jgi:methyl-accepting chemotaxis protein